MPAIRAGIIRVSQRMQGPPTKSGSKFLDPLSKSYDNEPVPPRVIERMHEKDRISPLPATIHTKAKQSSTTTMYETTNIWLLDNETKHDIGSIRHIASVTEHLHIDREKPLPLPPISDTSPWPQPLSTERGELRRFG